MNEAHPYRTDSRQAWQRRHALTVSGEYEACGIERKQGPTDNRKYFYPTIIYRFTEQGRRVHPVVTKWNIDGTNALSNFEDLDMRTVLV
ncbi:hypothetical protein PSAR109036_01910 [Psychrobacter arenosus]|uniref:hypothetical protein n=1 Tax=Psychrobacter arenosus TaxID=256326 RepID=UPI001919BBB5|nr:hypothetical protein [Psychrobacter arenosus]